MVSEVAYVTRPREGETENGDRAVVCEIGDVTLLAVVDALGHGPVAAEVADTVERVLRGLASAHDLAAIFGRLHAELRGSRGCALTIAAVTETEILTAGVGNVELRASGVKLSFVSSPGVVGGQIRKLLTQRSPRPASGRLVLFSDGISSRCDPASVDGLAPPAACAALLERSGRHIDDATVLIAQL